MAYRRASGSAESAQQHVYIIGCLIHQAVYFFQKKSFCQKGVPELSESLAVRSNRQRNVAPKNAGKVPLFSWQRFVANLRPTVNLSGNALTPCPTISKVENSGETLYYNHLDGDNLSSDLRQTFVTSAANLPGKAQ
jgi:hypothetical protein